MSCKKCGKDCFGPVCAECKGEKRTKTINGLTAEQQENILAGWGKGDRIARFLVDGCAIDLRSGELMPKGTNVMCQPAYWKVTKGFCITVKEYLLENNPGHQVTAWVGWLFKEDCRMKVAIVISYPGRMMGNAFLLGRAMAPEVQARNLEDQRIIASRRIDHHCPVGTTWFSVATHDARRMMEDEAASALEIEMHKAGHEVVQAPDEWFENIRREIE